MEQSKEVIKKQGILLKLFKLLLKFLGVFFPFIKIIKINRLLRRASQVYDQEESGHPYFFNQRIKNWLLVLLTVSPILLGGAFSYTTVSSNKALQAASKLAIKEYNKNKSILIIPSIIKAKNKFDKVLKNPKVKKYNPQETINQAIFVFLLGVIVSFMMGLVITRYHPNVVETKILTKMLRDQGMFKNNKDPIVLATPLGYLIDITGYRPREIEENQNIWMALNVRIDGSLQDSEVLALVFFTRAYELKKSYFYEFDSKGSPKY